MMLRLTTLTKTIRRAVRARRQSLAFIAIVTLCGYVAGSPALAQAQYPNRTIRIVVGFAPGGIADIIARLVGEQLTSRYGQTVVIDNKGGAAGALGAQLVASSDADGYTLLVTTTAVAINSAASASATNPSNDLTPIAMVASSPTIFAVSKSELANDLGSYLKGRRTLSYATSGAGTTEHLTAAFVFNRVAGLSATHVPYRSGSEVTSSAIGGHVDLAVTAIPAAASFIKDKALKVLAVAARKRLVLVPDAPTLAEAGLTDVENASWIAVFAPRGLPASIADGLNEAINQSLPKIEERLTTLGFNSMPMSRTGFNKYIDEEMKKWHAIIKETGALAQ
jgi:tripartite-type tricarboxylate transporter receptor subunit TctC